MSKTILIVDDDREFCDELAEALKGEDFDAHCVFSSHEAEELLETNNFDVLILDFKMPEINGIDFLERNKERLKKTRVFIISGSLAVGKLIAERGFSGLVSEILNKPFPVETLLERINSA